MREPMEKMYGKEYFKSTWENWIDAMTGFYTENNGDICKSLLPVISCPTLIIHGAKDAMVPEEHAYYLQENIKGAR